MQSRAEYEGSAATAAEVPSMTLGAYLAEIGRAVRTGLPRAWVQAVVLTAKAMKQGISLELVEPTVDESNDGRRADRRDGQLRGMIWHRTIAEIEASIGLPLDPAILQGAHVRLLVRTTFGPRWHLGCDVLGLDPTMVEGLIARRLEEIRSKLRQASLYGAQQQLAEPGDIVAVAVIHPAGAAGWADVEAELRRMERAGIVRVTSHAVPFEGTGAAGKIADALKAIGEGERLDVILLIRGGGAASGLAALANLGLARALCLCPVPVITGIGHASDRSLLDELAWRAADTPSKALGVVEALLRKRAAKAVEDHRGIVDRIGRCLADVQQPRLIAARSALIDAADRITAAQEKRLREIVDGVHWHVMALRGTLDLSQAELDHVADALLAATPVIPRTAAARVGSLYAGLIHQARARLPAPEALPAEADRSAGAVASFVAAQATALRSLVGALEAALHRRLGEEASGLNTLGQAARALDLDATLARGFTLPLDRERRILRSAAAAQAAGRIELLFADGPVACRPSIS